MLQPNPKPPTGCLCHSSTVPLAGCLGGFASVSRPVDSVDYSISLWSVKLRKQFQLSPKARCRPRPKPSRWKRQTRWQRVKATATTIAAKNKNIYVCNNRGKKNKCNYDALFLGLSPFWASSRVAFFFFFFIIFGLPAKLAQLKFSAAHLAIDLKFSLPWQKGQNLIKHLLGQHWAGQIRVEAEQKRERMQQIGADNFVGQHSEASGLEAKQGIQISSLWANECKTLP